MKDRRVIRDCVVAVVGGAGFLGSHLVDHLINDRNCAVLVLDNLITGRREFIHPKAKFEHADICRSESYMRSLFKGYDVEYVFNYAAEPYVPLSFARPLHVWNTNAMGAIQVINAAWEAGCKAILQVSSAEIYGEGNVETLYQGYSVGGDLSKLDPSQIVQKHLPIKENAPVCPHSSYGVSKAAVDAAVQVRWHEAKTPCIALRQFNCVGERETHPYVIPEIVKQLNKWVPPGPTPAHNFPGHFNYSEWPIPTIRLGNNSFRDFLYSGDQARMATELLERGKFGEVYNLGSESGVKIYDLAKLIGEVMGFTDVEIEEDPKRKRPWEIWHLQSNNNKIYGVIEARPTVSLEEAIKRTVAWYHDNGDKWPWE